MEKVNVKYELETSHGSIYGFEEAAALMEILGKHAPSCDKKSREFEDAFAAYCGTKHALSVTNGTTGLTLTGMAAGIGPGDEVITTPLSWISTASSYSLLGAKVVFGDVDPDTLNLDPATIEAKITPKTKAIVAVHLYGQCARMEPINAIARAHHLLVIEDCAHNPGGEYRGKRSGGLGDMGVFSFHQQKNMSTLGEGGMVTTNDEGLYEKLLAYRSLCARTFGDNLKYLHFDETKFPMEKRYWYLEFEDFGTNFRMTDAQAAVGLVQLKKLDAFNARRIQIAERLTRGLAGIPGLKLPFVDPDVKHVFHVYVVQIEPQFPLSKVDFMWEMYTKKGIKVWSHYMPIHLTKPYRAEGHREGECPVLEAAYHRYVSLPVHPRLTDEAVDYMIQSIRELAEVRRG